MSRPELSYVVVARLPIGGANDTHAVAGLEMTELQQHHGQVVDEELGVHQGHGKLDDAMVVLILERPRVKCVSGEDPTLLAHPEPYLSVEDPDPVEEPVRHGEQQRESGEEGTVHAHPGQAGSAGPQEQGPHGHQEDEELEGDGEEEAFAGRAAGLQSVRPHDGREQQEDQGRGHHQEPNEHAHSQGKVAPEALGSVLELLPQANHFLLGNAQLRGSCHGGGGFPPVVILEEEELEVRRMHKPKNT